MTTPTKPADPPAPTQLPAEPRRTIRERLALLRDLINNQNTEPHGLNWGQATAIARDLDAIVNDIPEAPEKPEKPGRPERPDHGLPGERPERPERPDHELPGERPRPDHELPETGEPKRGATSGRRI